jgi:hypothetical protein
VPLDNISAYPVRDELRRLNEELVTTSTAERDEAQPRVDRLQLPLFELDKTKADLTALRAAYDAVRR